MTDEVKNTVREVRSVHLDINLETINRVAAYTRDGLYRIRLPEPLLQVVGVNAELTPDAINKICRAGYVFMGSHPIPGPDNLLIPKSFISYEFTSPQTYIPPVDVSEATDAAEVTKPIDTSQPISHIQV